MSFEFRPQTIEPGRSPARGQARDAGERQMAMPLDLSARVPLPNAIHLHATPRDIRLDLGRAAIIVIDMQNDFCSPGGLADCNGQDLAKARAPIGPLQAVLPLLRASAVPLIWLNWGNRADRKNIPAATLRAFDPDGHGLGLGSELPSGRGRVLEKDGWPSAIIDELETQADDIFVDKYRISGFWDTPLDSILRNLDVKTVFFAGVNTDVCVLHTLADASFLGYDCVLLEDCCSTTAPDFCVQSTLWNIRKCFGFVTGTAALKAAIGSE